MGDGVTSHVVYVSSEAGLRAFVARHDPCRLVLYDPRHEQSMRVVARIAAEGGHVATAAVEARRIPEYADSEIPRVIVLDRGGGGGRRALGDASNVHEFGRHFGKVDTRTEAHVLLLAGNRNASLAVGLFARAGSRSPGTKFVYARAGGRNAPAHEHDPTQHLFDTFGFRPWMPNQVHFVGGKAKITDSFEFSTEDEFWRGWGESRGAE